MVTGVADTHAALWWLYDDPRLSRRAQRFIDDSAQEGRKIGVSSISLAEVVYLAEKKRIFPTAFQDLRAVLNDPGGVFQEVHLTQEIVSLMQFVPRGTVPDLPDRIICATALYLAVPLLSCDERIRGSNVQTLW